MNTRTKTLFKTWQALPVLPAKRAECPPPNPGARVCDSPRLEKTCRSVPKRDAARLQKLKFILTTHD